MAIQRERLIRVAQGQERADLVLRHARIVNVFNGEIEEGDVALAGEGIAAIGPGYEGIHDLDLEGRHLLPGLINGHTHLESSMLSVGQYAKAVVAHGTTAVVTDLHEIANVGGLSAMRYILNEARPLPFDLHLMVPSCVPATSLETAGAQLSAEDVARALRWQEAVGLGEVMNFPGVLAADAAVLDKVGQASRYAVDGHSPGLAGRPLQAYLAAGIGSDHECTRLEEAREKLARGMYIFIREGSSERNLEELLPLVTDRTYPRCLFVVDDRSCADLMRDGDVDAVVRKAIALGLDPVRAVQLATINPATYFRLLKTGAVAPGYYANLVVVEELSRFEPQIVFYRGHEVARDGQALFEARPTKGGALRDSMNVKPYTIQALRLETRGASFPIIQLVPGQIVTQRRDEPPPLRDGAVAADPERDILKLAVIERHRATGHIGLGLLGGLGLKRGAIATSVAHDSHNIVAAGVSDGDVYAAARAVEDLDGGLVVVADGQVQASLSLPIGGLLSDRPLAEVVADTVQVEEAARALGATLPAPFAALSFVALPVIPDLRLTDRGLVDPLRGAFLDA